ncbi:hypothetical protein [Alkanindiges illinoisensis]|nr:hypothetical protein [Alkanindiges illinoisensis]
MIKTTGLTGLLLLVTQAVQALPVPGSQITNIASGDYVDEQGNVQVINSNPVSLTIQKVYALTLQQNQQQVATLGAPVAFPHLLTNTGNSADQYLLTLTQLSSAFNMTGLSVYADRNQDGVADDNVNLNNTQVSLESGESLAVVVVGSVPVNSTAASQSSITLQATSQQNPALNQLVTDVVTVVDQAVINVTKSQSISSGSNGAIITYTFTYTNTGTAAGRLSLTDLLNASLQYQTGSAVWSSGTTLTDADDNEGTVNASNTGISYRLVGSSQIEFGLDSIAPLTSGSVSFKAAVRSTADKKIPNTGSYSQYNGTNTTPVKTTTTNTVVFTRQDQLGVVLNNNSLSSSNNGNPASSPHNLIVKDGAVAGQDISFDNYVWNTGNTSDTYNLSYSASNLPACAQVQFFAADGRSPLNDSNGDGLVDTGALASGQARLIKVIVITTPTCSSNNVINIDVQARSATNSTVSDPVRNQINQIASQGATDLTNGNGSGTGVGNIDNNGSAWLAKSVVAGQSTAFPLVINNTGSSSNNYNLIVSASAISLNTLNTASSLPTGWDVKFYNGDASCTTLGQQIVNSGTIAAGASKTYCAVVSAPVNASQTVLPLWFAITSPVNGQGDVIKDQVNLPQARRLELTNDQQGQVRAGGTTVYLHTLKNTGAVTEGQNTGDVLLSLQALNVNDGFSYTLYFDANNNGLLDSGDPIVSDLHSIAGSGLSPSHSVQLLVKVQAPATATNGIRSQVQLIVTPTGQVAGLSASSVQNTDTTTVNPNQLRLTKAQAKNELCASSNFASLTYSTSGVQVKPNQCVVYRLTVRNEGAEAVDAVVIQDMVPVYTTLLTPPGVSVSQGSASANNGQIIGNVGTLLPQQDASLYFSIRVNP